jgi:hypothetical protein
MCIDMNTMEVVGCRMFWTIRTAPRFLRKTRGRLLLPLHNHVAPLDGESGNDPRKGTVPIWKINAITGEIVWKTEPYPCYTIEGVSGGVQSSPVLGRGSISNLVLFTIARTPASIPANSSRSQEHRQGSMVFSDEPLFVEYLLSRYTTESAKRT